MKWFGNTAPESAEPLPTGNKGVGNLGEEIAAAFLEGKQYRILERNFRCKGGEVDIVARDSKDKCLVFVEVKYRTGFDPAETISKKKLDRLVSSALLYTAGQRSFRIDVFACTPKGCTWYKG